MPKASMGPPLVNGGNEAYKAGEPLKYIDFNGAAVSERRKFSSKTRPDTQARFQLQWGRR